MMRRLNPRGDNQEAKSQVTAAAWQIDFNFCNLICFKVLLLLSLSFTSDLKCLPAFLPVFSPVADAKGI